jgi:arabinogalactan endo-1,4-beta-galactosidase
MKKTLGNVKNLCRANANTPSGDKKGIFYWEMANGQKSSIGFEWCETEFEL